MNDNIIIELRERDSKPLDSFVGNFESQLSKPVNIQSGDTIILKSAFIDTVEQTSNQIILNENITVELKYGIYINDLIPTFIRNLTTPPAEPNYPISYVKKDGTLPGITQQDFQPSIPYKNLTPSGASFSSISTWLFAYLGDPFIKNTSPFNFVIQYTDISNTVQKKTYYVPSFGPGTQGGGSNFYYLNLNNLVYVDGSFSVVSPSPSDYANYQVIDQGPQGVQPYVSSGVYRPYEFSYNFDIDKGSYNASEFSLLVSKKLSNNYLNPTNPQSTVSNNPFLKTTNQFLQGQPYPDGSTGNITGDTIFIKNDFSNAFIFTSNQTGKVNTFFIGASQLALEYNENSQQFEFTYLHTPYYDSSNGQNMITKYFQNSLSKFITVSNLGGIYFTQMTAKVKETNKYFDFWNEILGFNVGKMTVKIGNYGTEQGSFGLTNSLFDKLEPLTIGSNITNMYVGVDSTINKQVNQWFYQGNTTFESIADPAQTNKITASTPLPVLLDTFSHYLIEIQAGFYNELIGQETFRTINGIVSKYYGYSSYTFDAGEGAIQYTHKGNELQLKSIRVRILRSDKSRNIPGLGDDNTFYLQIIKAPPQKPAITN
jgi:hypothetical protein